MSNELIWFWKNLLSLFIMIQLLFGNKKLKLITKELTCTLWMKESGLVLCCWVPGVYKLRDPANILLFQTMVQTRLGTLERDKSTLFNLPHVPSSWSHKNLICDGITPYPAGVEKLSAKETGIYFINSLGYMHFDLSVDILGGGEFPACYLSWHIRQLTEQQPTLL